MCFFRIFLFDGVFLICFVFIIHRSINTCDKVRLIFMVNFEYFKKYWYKDLVQACTMDQRPLCLLFSSCFTVIRWKFAKTCLVLMLKVCYICHSEYVSLKCRYTYMIKFTSIKKKISLLTCSTHLYSYKEAAAVTPIQRTSLVL